MLVPRALLLLLLVTFMLECVSAKKPPRPKKPCKYNKKKYPAGTVIESIADNCVELKCSVKGKKTELVLIEGCTCCKPVTELPTTTVPPKPTTVPPKPTPVPPKPTTVPPKPTPVPPKPTMVPPKPTPVPPKPTPVPPKTTPVPPKPTTVLPKPTPVPPKPTPVPPKPTPVPPKPTTVPHTPVTEGSSGNDCDYSATFGSTHTMNLAPNDACVYHLNEVSASEKQTILQKHNELRAKVANGLEDGAIDGAQPSATNMLELRWSTKLAEVAQAWAEQCADGHDKYDDRKICDQSYSHVGQNIYSSWSYDAASKWEDAVVKWYEEVEYMTSSLIDSFGSPSSGNVIGHYTQVVWADTYEVGCGAIHYPDTYEETTYPESKIYVCNYGPNGNWLNNPVYESGTTASNCPNGPSSEYPGLCAAPPA